MLILLLCFLKIGFPLMIIINTSKQLHNSSGFRSSILIFSLQAKTHTHHPKFQSSWVFFVQIFIIAQDKLWINHLTSTSIARRSLIGLATQSPQNQHRDSWRCCWGWHCPSAAKFRSPSFRHLRKLICMLWHLDWLTPSSSRCSSPRSKIAYCEHRCSY